MIPCSTPLLTTRPTDVGGPFPWYGCRLTLRLIKPEMASRLPTNPTNPRGYSIGRWTLLPRDIPALTRFWLWFALSHPYPPKDELVSVCAVCLCRLMSALNGRINCRLLLVLGCLWPLPRTSSLGREVDNCR